MKNTLNTLLLSLFVAVFAVACNSSASSEAKKVEIKKVEAPATVDSTASNNTQPSSDVKPAESMKLGDFVEGKHFVRIKPSMQTDVAEGKIEVAELFWLGCPHCYSLEPEIVKYKANHPDYVAFKQVPAMLNPRWAADANTFYIAEMLDPQGKKDLIGKLFTAMHEQKRRLRSPKAVTRFFVEQGYTEEQVENVKSSMAFQAKLVRAQEFGAASQADAVPSMIVNGKYRTSPYMAGGNEMAMKLVSLLVEKEKAAQ